MLEWIMTDVALWLGIERATLFGLLDGIPLRPGAVETLRALHEGGVGLAILSTGFLRVVRRSEEAAGFSLPAWANEMRFDDAGRLTSVTMMTSGEGDSPLSKRALVPAIVERFGTVSERTLAVGDSSGDTGMFGEAGYSLAVHGAPEIGARARLPEPDLRCCLPWVFPRA